MPDYPSRQAFEQAVSRIACPDCGQLTLQLVEREQYIAKPIGSFSLAGQQMKVSAHGVLWPWIVCSRPECDFEKPGKPA